MTAKTKLDHALELAALGFHVFPLEPNSKLPRIDGFPRRATRDEDQIRRWWTCPVMGIPLDFNIGISTTRFGENDALLVIDVDNKGDKRGGDELLALEMAGMDFPETFEQSTPTGGRHLVYLVEQPVKQGTDVLAPGLDVRSQGGYIVGAGSTTEQGSYGMRGRERTLHRAPAWCVSACGRDRGAGPRPEAVPGAQVDPQRAAARAGRYLAAEAPLAVEGQGGDQTTYAVAARVKDFGVGEAECLALMLEHWNDRCSPPWDPEELRRKVTNAYRYGREPVGAGSPEAQFSVSKTSVEIDKYRGNVHPFDKLNREYAFVLAGGGYHILWETTDANGGYRLEHLSPAAFHAKHAAAKMTVGKRSTPVTELWMDDKARRSYDGICFMPGLPTPDRFYNLWRGFAYEPAPKDGVFGQAAKRALDDFLAHAKDNVCHGDRKLFNWLIGYFAHLVQKPWEKPLVALVFRGGKGVGKNALIDRIGALLGSHFLLTSNRRYLVHNFNGHLENLLMFALDEAFWSGDKQAEGVLKDLITGKTHVIEHKGKEPYKVDNRTRVVIIGNEDWLVPASSDERRFAVFDVGDGRKQDRGFFQSMREGMEAGGYRLLLRYLLDCDLAGFDPNEAPATKGLLEQKHASLDPLAQWWLDCLTEGYVVGSDFSGNWPKEIETDRVRAAYRRYGRERNVRSRAPDDRAFGRALKKFAPGVRKSRKSVEGGLSYTYLLPSLDAARKEWEQHIGHEVNWE